MKDWKNEWGTKRKITDSISIIWQELPWRQSIVTPWELTFALIKVWKFTARGLSFLVKTSIRKTIFESHLNNRHQIIWCRFFKRDSSFSRRKKGTTFQCSKIFARNYASAKKLSGSSDWNLPLILILMTRNNLRHYIQKRQSHILPGKFNILLKIILQFWNGVKFFRLAFRIKSLLETVNPFGETPRNRIGVK